MAVAEVGGTVVDVAIVAALTAMCTEPGVCGAGGGGFLTIDLPGRKPVVVDGYMAYPGIGFRGEAHVREVTMAYGGGVTTLVDAGSIAVPGAFAAFDLASQTFGAVPWRALMETVAVAVEDGFPLSTPCHLYLEDGAATIFTSDPVAREALFDGDDLRAPASTIVFPGLVETLRHIGEVGAEDFYRGDVSRQIVRDLAVRGGRLTSQDMAAYRAVARHPVVSSVGDWRLALNPPPALGGVTVSRAVSLAADGDVDSLARALITVFGERNEGVLRSPSTVSVAAADDDGGAVAGSFSAGYGSGVIPAGTGMLMNNALGELELSTRPGQAGDRMISNMAPTVARRAGGAVAIGSPGADRITSAVATTLIRLAMGDTLQQAIDHPRVHPEFGEFGVRLAVEPGQETRDLGTAVREYESLHMFFGGVNGAGLIDGSLQAHADARRTGSVGFTA